MYSEGNRNRGGGRGAYRTASGGFARQSAAPYSRRVSQRDSSSQDNIQQAPSQQQRPSQLSIRGASSIPTQALVSNLAKGTSAEDVRQTFLQFGDIIRVKERRMPGADPGSVSFEVLFEERAGAKKAVEQLDRALADGRILSVVIEEDTSVAAAAAAAASPTSTVSTPKGPSRKHAVDAMDIPSSSAPSPILTHSTTPLGPRSGRPASGGRGNQRAKELFEQDAVVVQKVAPTPTPRAVVTAAPRELLQTRPLTARERKQVAAAQVQVQSIGGRKGGNVATVMLLPSAPKGPKAQQQQSLQSRLGGLPLAQRLGEVKGAGAKSDLATLQSKKLKQAAKKSAPVPATLKAAAEAGGNTGSSASKKRKQKSKEKAANAGGAGMELD